MEVPSTRLSPDELSVRLVELNKDFTRNVNHGIPDNCVSECVNHGSKILLTAIHSVVHDRDQHPKLQDNYTGGITRLLGELTGVNTFVSLCTISEGRPWDQRSDQLKDELDAAIGSAEIVIDIHGMARHIGKLVSIGEGPSPDEFTRTVVRDLQRRIGWPTSKINVPFAGRSPYTVSSYIEQTTSKHAIQLEPSPEMRQSFQLFHKRKCRKTFGSIVQWLAYLERSVAE